MAGCDYSFLVCGELEEHLLNNLSIGNPCIYQIGQDSWAERSVIDAVEQVKKTRPIELFAPPGSVARHLQEMPMNLFDIRAQWPDQTTEDAQEVAEWRDALLSVIAHSGTAQAKQILDMLVAVASTSDIGWRPSHSTPYINTISVECQPVFPGDLAIEERLASIMRWNALAMVARANYAYGELGGHIASYASAADLFEVGFNHFFQSANRKQRWRSGVLSTALGARGLCSGVPRGTPGRKRICCIIGKRSARAPRVPEVCRVTRILG
nr:hypothetical protein GCM10020185_86450 [Pseudomonas brassicacearum subsp. brassicacearum]